MGTVSNRSVGVGFDPLTDTVARVLSIPLRELYAVLWRVGIVEIGDSSVSDEARRGASTCEIAAAATVAAAADPRAWAQPTGPSGVLPSS